MNIDELITKKKLTQTEFAFLVGINQATVSKALSEGILTRGADWVVWNRELLRHSMEVASGRGGGPLDLAQERARLAALQSERIEIELDQLRGDLWPVGPIAETVGWHIDTLKTKMLSLPHRFKSIAPSTLPRDINALDDLIREALTDFGQLRLPARFVKMAQRYFEKRRSNAKRSAEFLINRKDQTTNGHAGKRTAGKFARDQARNPTQGTTDVESDRERCPAGS